ncbi:hypothetical protein [Amycolatopsis sp. CA-230715]|uniref:hypothetical protein n=1 Tax=Amycolatopsis sp. CA-230715 TaxID=2745196 RepID=UPI001C0240C1|nr:hypothetical protein [Amycolatopsis sp. CA-230715]
MGEVKRWNPGALNGIASAIQQREQVLIHSGDDYGKILPVDGWEGSAADTAVSSHKNLMDQIETLAAGASVVCKALMQASDAIPACRTRSTARRSWRTVTTTSSATMAA